MLARYSIDSTVPTADVAALHRALRCAGWQETAGDDWDFYWAGGPPDADFYRSLPKWLGSSNNNTFSRLGRAPAVCGLRTRRELA